MKKKTPKRIHKSRLLNQKTLCFHFCNQRESIKVWFLLYVPDGISTILWKRFTTLWPNEQTKTGNVSKNRFLNRRWLEKCFCTVNYSWTNIFSVSTEILIWLNSLLYYSFVFLNYFLLALKYYYSFNLQNLVSCKITYFSIYFFQICTLL